MQGASNIPRRGRRLQVLLAFASILVIAVAMVLLVWVFPSATSSGDGAKDANPNAGAAVVHDDAGNMPVTGAGAAVVHDDAGNVR